MNHHYLHFTNRKTSLRQIIYPGQGHQLVSGTAKSISGLSSPSVNLFDRGKHCLKNQVFPKLTTHHRITSKKFCKSIDENSLGVLNTARLRPGLQGLCQLTACILYVQALIFHSKGTLSSSLVFESPNCSCLLSQSSLPFSSRAKAAFLLSIRVRQRVSGGVKCVRECSKIFFSIC